MPITLTSDILKNIPKTPWIYQYFDKNGKIIYIWKSVNLFSRVHSYFNGKSKLNFAKQKMVDQICDIKTILTNNERESLILETTLIKQHLPKYNILMKDGKSHIYIKITSEPIPRIITTRIKWKTWDYFGPYISTWYVKSILKTAKKIFGYRSCNLIFMTSNSSPYKGEDTWKADGGIEDNKKLEIKNVNMKIPCLDYYIKRCSGPCLLQKKEIAEYRESIDLIRNFLKWNFTEVKMELTEKMKQFARELNFEKAEEIKRELLALDSLHETQVVKDLSEPSANIIHFLQKFEKTFIGILKIREHKIVWFYPYEIENKLEESPAHIVCELLEKMSLEENLEKVKHILPFEIGSDEFHNISSLIQYEVPQIGVKSDLLKLCYKNIYEFAYKKHLASLSTKWFTKQNMKNLLHTLGYERINKKILFECNDISHLSGTHTVASRSVIENGKTANSLYRKFKIKNLEVWKIDDFNSMREIMERRIQEIIKAWIIPDLIIIDWWKGQLSSVVEIVDRYLDMFKKSETNNYNILSKLQLVWIAKREEELFIVNKSPFLDKEGEASETGGGGFTRILLSKDSQELKMVQKIRDEAHRFAITFNRDSRIKSMKKNILESLPWFWPVARKKILKTYWNVEELKNVPKNELQKILNVQQIETLDDHWLLW